jgi:hypothetical protein
MHMTSTESVRKAFRIAGGLLTFVTCALAFTFGLSVKSDVDGLRWLVALGLVVAAFCSAYIWMFVAEAYRRRDPALTMLAVFACLFTATDLTTAFGTLSFHKSSDIHEAQVSKVNYDDVGAEIASNAEAADAMEQRAKELEKANGWIGKVTAVGLRSDISVKEHDIATEKARGGCGPICGRMMKEKAALEKQLALTEQYSDLRNQIEASRKAASNFRQKRGGMEVKESAVVNQNMQFASLFTLSLTPSATAMHWTDKGINWLIAFFFAFGAIGCNNIGFSGAGSVDDRRTADAGRVEHDVYAGSDNRIDRSAQVDPISVPVKIEVDVSRNTTINDQQTEMLKPTHVRDAFAHRVAQITGRVR